MTGRKRLRKLVEKEYASNKVPKYDDMENEVDSTPNMQIPREIEDAVNGLDENGKKLLCEFLSLAQNEKSQRLEELKKMSKAKTKKNKKKKNSEEAKGDCSNKKSRKKRLDKLASKVNDQVEEQKLDERAARRAKRVADDYALGKDIEDDEDAPDPLDVAKELDNDSLYCEDEDSANYSDDSEKNKQKKKKKRNNKKTVKMNGKSHRIIKPKNKLYDDIYEEERSDED